MVRCNQILRIGTSVEAFSGYQMTSDLYVCDFFQYPNNSHTAAFIFLLGSTSTFPPATLFHIGLFLPLLSFAGFA